MNFSEFTRGLARDTYPEPRCDLHDKITTETAERVAVFLPPADAKVLDVGCGQGPALDWFCKNKCIPVGITTNVTDLQACRIAGFDVRLEDQNNLPQSWTGLFDCVWARHVLEHSVAPFWTLSEFDRVLKPGGILYLEMPSPDTAANHEANKNHYSVMGWRMWAMLIDRSGFEVLEASQRQFVIPGLGPDLYFSFICQKKK